MPLLRYLRPWRPAGYICPACAARFCTPGSASSQQRKVTTRTVKQGIRKKSVPVATKRSLEAPVPQPVEDPITRTYEQGVDGELLSTDSLNKEQEAFLLDRISTLERQLAKLGRTATSKLNRNNSTSDTAAREPTGDHELDNLIDIRKAGLEIPALSDGQLDTAEPDIPRWPFPLERQRYIATLNALLHRVRAKQQDVVVAKELWKWYSLCRKTLSQAWSEIPKDVWLILWTTFSRESLSNPDRMNHIKTLGADMTSAQIQLGSTQQLLFIEALFQEGDQEDAIRKWHDSRLALTFEPVTESQYWAMGSRMYAHHGDPEKAQEAADVHLNGTGGRKDPIILVPVMRAWIESTDVHGTQRAWAMYVRLLVHAEGRLQMEDYDACIAVFADAGRFDLALAVFRDMMLSTDSDDRLHWGSIASYKRCLSIRSDLEKLTLEPSETAWTETAAFTSLPRKFRNKFFFGSWIKKLLGDGRIDWASQVINLMRERGVSPDARHLNGIIGARFRLEMTKESKTAEELAWKMINDRVAFVKRRAQSSGLSGVVRAWTSNGKADNIGVWNLQSPARATIETFSVLADHYRIHQQDERLQELCNMMEVAAIKPDIGFLNILLSVGASSNRKVWAWALYQKIVGSHGVIPDHETFSLLWKIMKNHADPVKTRTRAGFPSCRTLFAEMGKYAPQLQKQKQKLARQTYQKIILSFGLSDDQIGTGLALHLLHHYFDVCPDHETLRSIVLQLAKAGNSNQAGFAPRRLNLNSQQKARVAKITALVAEFKAKRNKSLVAHGTSFDQMEAETKGEQMILLLCDVLRFVVQSRTSVPEQLSNPGALPDGDTVDFEQLAGVAALQMGMRPGISLPWALEE